MPGLMLDTDQPELLATPHFQGCRVATYADLITPAMLSEFAGRLVVIDRGRGDPHNVATVADIEPGCLSVAEGAARIRAWNAEHRPFTTAYSDRADRPAIASELSGVPHFEWIATLDGTPVPGGDLPAAVQMFDAVALGFHADVRLVWDDNWHPIRPAVSWKQFDALAAAVQTTVQALAALR